MGCDSGKDYYRLPEVEEKTNGGIAHVLVNRAIKLEKRARYLREAARRLNVSPRDVPRKKDR